METRARCRGVIELTVAVGLPAAAAALLHRLGAHPRLQIDWSDLELWLQIAPVDDVAAALLRLVGLAAAYWVLATTALYLLARLTRVPAAIRAVEWTTLPVVRRAADRAVALALVGSTLTGHAGAALAAEPSELPGVPPPPVVQLDADDADGDDGHLYEPTPAGDGPPGPARVPAEPSGPPGQQRERPTLTGDGQADRDPAPSRSDEGGAADARDSDRAGQPPSGGDQDDAGVHEVAAGDNLWAIAEQALATAWGRAPSAAEVAPYWLAVIDRNVDRLRSGDPDLIYPGELLDLPATPQEDGDD